VSTLPNVLLSGYVPLYVVDLEDRRDPGVTFT